MSVKQHPFISYLVSIRDSGEQSRAILATLRRGLGKEPGEDANVLRYVVPWLPAVAQPWSDRPYFLIASLFALHPAAGGAGDMGKHFAAIRQGKPSEEAIERRFTALLNTHADDLADQLRQAVSLCKANGVSIDWHQLFRDIQGWGHANRWVQRNWAHSFWGRASEEQQPNPATAESTVQNLNP